MSYINKKASMDALVGMAGIEDPMQKFALQNSGMDSGGINNLLQQVLAAKMEEKMARDQEEKYKIEMSENVYAMLNSDLLTPEEKTALMLESMQNGIDVSMFKSTTGQKWGHGVMSAIDSLLFDLVPDELSRSFETGYGDQKTAETIGNLAGMAPSLAFGGSLLRGGVRAASTRFPKMGAKIPSILGGMRGKE